jgi:hypothetical protein
MLRVACAARDTGGAGLLTIVRTDASLRNRRLIATKLPLDGLAEVLQQMKAVSNLPRLRRTLACGLRISARGDRNRTPQRAMHVAARTEVALKNRPVRPVYASLRHIGVDFDFVMLKRAQCAGYRPPAVSTCIHACIFRPTTASRRNKNAANRFRRRSHVFNSSAGADRRGRAGSRSRRGKSRNSFPP